MNELNPVLKKLLLVAEKVERSSEIGFETPPRYVVLRILNRCAPRAMVSQPSLLEFMVQRGAAIAAVVGLLTLTVQILAGGSSIGILNGITGPCAALFRTFLP